MGSAHSAIIVAFERYLEANVEGMPEKSRSEDAHCGVDQLHRGAFFRNNRLFAKGQVYRIMRCFACST